MTTTSLSSETHGGRVQRGLTVGISGLAAQADDESREGYHRALRTMVTAAQVAEAWGLDAAWTSEHHFSSSGFMPAPFVALAALAERTDAVTIGTDVMLPSMWDPVRFAEEACVVDQLSRGRLLLALGIGYRDYEFEGLGFYRKNRVRQLRECVRVLREMAGGSVTGVGSLPAGVALPVSPRPFQPDGPPVWGGGKVEAAVRRARRFGQGYFASMMSPTALRRRVDWLHDEAPLDDFAVAQTTLAFVATRNAAEIATPGLRHVQGYMRSWKSEVDASTSASLTEDANREWQLGDEWQAATPGSGAVAEEQLTHALIVGTPDECVERFRPFVEALADAPGNGPRHLSARLTYPMISEDDTVQCIRLFAAEVAPALREIFDARTGAQRKRATTT